MVTSLGSGFYPLIPTNKSISPFYEVLCFGWLGAVMHKVCNIVFAVLRDKKPFEIISPEEHKSHYKQHLSLAA